MCVGVGVGVANEEWGLVGAESTGRSPGWKGAFRDSGGRGEDERV